MHPNLLNDLFQSTGIQLYNSIEGHDVYIEWQEQEGIK